MILFVRASTLEDDVARNTRFRDEAELALVKNVFLRLELNENLDRQISLLFFVARHWRHEESLGYLTQRE